MGTLASRAVTILVASAILTAIGGFAKLTSVEQDLGARGQSVLAAGDDVWGTVSFVGREATLTGTAPTPEEQKQAVEMVDAVWGVRSVKDETKLLPAVSPYTLTAEKSGDTLSVSGTAPRGSVRKAFAGSARSVAGIASVKDDLQLGRGAPKGLAEAYDYGLKLLGFLSGGKVEISDTVLSVSGETNDRAAYDQAMNLVANAPTGFSLGSVEILAPKVAPFTWSAKRTPEGIELSGYIPDEATRKALVAEAEKLGFGSVEDKMQAARGASDGFAALSSFGLSRLASLAPGGTATISDNALTLSGEAVSREAFKTLLQGADAADLSGATIAASVPEPPVTPYAWGATVGDSSVKLDGYVPNDATRKSILDLVATKFGGFAISDAMETAPGAPKGFLDAVRVALQGASRLEKGSVKLVGDSVTLNGETFYAGALDAVKAYIDSHLPDAFSADLGGLAVGAPGAVVSSNECQALLSGTLKSRRILFETGKATIQEHSFGLLDNLVYLTQRCPEARVEIEGHTDSDGADDTNQALSEARAQAVATYLRDAGVTADRLTAVGYGETKPVASNDTDKGKAQNRRIEFRVVGE